MNPQQMIFGLCEALDSLIPSGPAIKASSSRAPSPPAAPNYALPPANVSVVVKHPGPPPDSALSDYERGYRAAEQRMKLERAQKGKAPAERDDHLACTMLLQLVRDVRQAVDDGALAYHHVDLSLPAAEGFLQDRQASRIAEQPRVW